MQYEWSDEQVLSNFGWENAQLLGEGGEARVFDIGGDRVLRLVRPGGRADMQQRRAELLQQIASGHTAAAFRTPRVIDVTEIGGRVAVIEERLSGISLADALETAVGGARNRLVRSYLDAASSIGDIKVHLPFWGDIIAPTGIRRRSYRTYLAEKLQRVRSASGDLAGLVIAGPESVADCSTPSLVHFDIFPSNVLVEADHVSAVIDFGASSMMADRRLDIWSAVAYLDPEISPTATDADRHLAMEWLQERGLKDDYPAAKRLIASCWCFAHDDPVMRSWCRRILSV